MRGYWREPELSNGYFYYRPVTEEFTDQFYRTGDLVSVGEGAEMLFHGRKDRQVKLRGFRIELDEIEAVLAEHCQVEEAGSYMTQNASAIEAAVALKTDADVSRDDLVNHCRNRMSQYAVPSEIHIIQAFPRTGSRKIDRRELAKLFGKRRKP